MVLSFFLINISLLLILLLILIVAVLSIFISLRLSITQAFVLIAEENAIDAMKLSWKFMEGRLLSYFGASIVVSVIGLIFNQIFETVAGPVFESAGTFNIIALILLPQVFTAALVPFLYISVFYLIKINYESDTESKIFLDTYHQTITRESLNSDI
ncbi:MAG: hypothetical protein IH840_00825 [Candidatus Heimdallarchaeota archaeon]|nr:hypothetical protein [Candidatus Heimdallarchaeota archaeon]